MLIIWVSFPRSLGRPERVQRLQRVNLHTVSPQVCPLTHCLLPGTVQERVGSWRVRLVQILSPPTVKNCPLEFGQPLRRKGRFFLWMYPTAPPNRKDVDIHRNTGDAQKHRNPADVAKLVESLPNKHEALGLMLTATVRGGTS